jgi:cellobiose phosphorylase
LWGYSISGDLPIVLVQIEDPGNINLIRQLIQAHAYWRLKGLSVDMIIWIEDYAGYRQSLYEQIMGIIAGGIEANIVGRPGGIFIRAGDQLSAEDKMLFQAVARIVISDKNGSLSEQLNRRISFDPVIAAFKPTRTYIPEIKTEYTEPGWGLEFFNGKGGFTPDGREYIIFTSKGKMTPAPWVNVLANDQFGTVISENGQSYTWSENAHEFRLSPWNNDFVSDRNGEAIYIRDEETGHFWSPTPFIKNGSANYKTRHGFGYSIFEHTETGIYSELCIYVSLDAPVKFSVLKIRNLSGRTRRLSVTGYVEWVLGDLRSKTAMHVNMEIDINSSAIYARNPFNFEFVDRVAFFETDDSSACSFTCDRTEFLGRNGSMSRPAAMNRSRLSGKRGAALDPCAAIQVTIEVENDMEDEIVFTLGSGKSTSETVGLANRFVSRDAARKELESIWEYWKNTLGSVQVETPDRALNYMVNGWLLYQTLASRIWARSGYYQSGGAYGFRDQLQDAMSVVHSKPRILHDQIILHAGRQFIEGDVQHWWHPPTGRGVRTRCSDDYLWLPLAVSRYVTCTGDISILDEVVKFLEGRPLNSEEESYYDLPNQSGESGTIYEHCTRAILHGLKFGDHGLPLIGSHDWNDGMNRIGHKGKGESVWLGFFLYDILMQYVKLSRKYGDNDFAERCEIEAELLRHNLESHAWDGKWYLRAFFDDGSPLGSHSNTECKIDSLSQSWAVLSEAGSLHRCKIAMEYVNTMLVRRDKGLVQLLDPAFDKSELNPGYIKGYVPGVRENGGQYTHAAIWAIMAFAKLGDKKNAWEILSLINPINHARSAGDSETYKVEPYVVAADVYSMPPHTGRGGWTWYTGSAGWMYRMILESLLGLRIESDKLYLEPVLPDDWNSFSLDYKFLHTTYKITVKRKDKDNEEAGVLIDGAQNNNRFIQLLDDNTDHHVAMIMP